MSTIKANLMDAIEKYIVKVGSGYTQANLVEAYVELRETYSSLKNNLEVSSIEPLIKNKQQRLAYILSRMPATTAVASQVFNEIKNLANINTIHSMLDLGSGTGAMIWAAIYSNLKLSNITAIDKDPFVMDLAKNLISLNQGNCESHIEWIQLDLNEKINMKTHDIVTMAYVLIEQTTRSMDSILESIWNLSNYLLVIIEPGSPKGFENILYARDYYLNKGGYIVAPCSHAKLCPLRNDWCHFNERIERTYWQRKLKGAVLGYEDEPYSYLVISKAPIEQRYGKRILFQPKKKSGHVILELCAPDTVEQSIITRSMGIKYKLAKKKNAGDSWDS